MSGIARKLHAQPRSGCRMSASAFGAGQPGHARVAAFSSAGHAGPAWARPRVPFRREPTAHGSRGWSSRGVSRPMLNEEVL